MRTLFARFAALFTRSRWERELKDEVEGHLEMLTAEMRGQGMDEDAARQAARREFGGIVQMQEIYRDRRGLPWIESFAKDVIYGLRGLRQHPAFTAAAVLSLAMGIGANTAIFSFLNALMLRMLPVERPEQLVSLYKTGGWGSGYASYPLYLMFRDHSELFSGVLARTGAWKARYQHRNQSGYVQTEYVSGNYFEVLGIQPALGRLFTDQDNRTPQGHPLAILSYDFWRNHFAADPAVLGRTVTVDERPVTVIGVAAPGFHGIEVERQPDLWVPAMMFRGQIMEPGMHWIWIVARRRDGVPAARVQAAANTIMQQYLAHYYGGKPDSAFNRWAMQERIEVRDGAIGISMLRDQFGKPLRVLMAAVALVLLIACANVANLLVARGAVRRREIALRFSLGATRMRIVRQWLIEALLLAAGGSLAGLLLAIWGERYMLLYLPPDAAPSFNVRPDRMVLGFTLFISVLSALLFGLAPALRATAVDPVAALKEGATTSRGGRLGLRRTLVVLQVAFSVVLVVMAGLFAHSLATLRSIHPGFVSQNVLTFSLDYPRAWKDRAKADLRQRLLDRIRSLPGVVVASYSALGPYQGGLWSAGMRVPGSARTAREGVEVATQGVGPGYFAALGSPPLAGREFTESDWHTARKIAIVNEAFVREFLPGAADPLTRVLSFDDSKPEGGEPSYIVGVVRNILHKGVKEAAEPTIYVPFQEGAVGFPPTVLVRAQTPPAALLASIQRELHALNADVAVTEPRTLSQRVDDSIYLDRMVATLGGFFGVVALILAAIGVYGVISYAVAQRTGEIGLRIALGAAPVGIQRMMLASGLWLMATGIAAGLPLALAAGRISASLLYAVKPRDPATLIVTVSLLMLVGVLAVWIPARRAALIQPVQALRHE